MDTKRIDTLVQDIYSLLSNGDENLDKGLCDKYGELFSEFLFTRFGKRKERKGTLRMSSIGQPCERKLYYEINSPEDAEELRPEVFMKFAYGDAIELLLLFLAEASGHTVEGTQDEQDIAGIKGHRDAVIDGTLVDVKSASTFSFQKFSEGKLRDDDPFGYVTQIQSYLHAGQSDDKVTDKDRAAFLVIDKTLGHICLDIHKYDPLPWEAIYERKKDLVSRDEAPIRGFNPVEDGKSGNMKLGTQCSYCPFKFKCHSNLRVYAYSTGPRFLTKVAKEPLVPEIT